MSLNFDLSPLFDAISTYVPLAMGIFGPIIGLGIAFALVVWVGGELRKQLGSKGGR